MTTRELRSAAFDIRPRGKAAPMSDLRTPMESIGLQLSENRGATRCRVDRPRPLLAVLASLSDSEARGLREHGTALELAH